MSDTSESMTPVEFGVDMASAAFGRPNSGDRQLSINMRPAARRCLIEGLRGHSAVEVQLPDGVTLAVSGSQMIITIPGGAS